MNYILYKERSSIYPLFFRASSKFKISESIIFVVCLAGLSQFYPYGTYQFKIGTIILAIITILIFPLAYKVIVKPEYEINQSGLTIRKWGKEVFYPYHLIQKGYDLKAIYYLNQKKTVLTVSDLFLEQLENNLQIYRALNRR